MSASVPEDLQISVGKTTTKLYLNDDNSWLVPSGTVAVAPNENNMWSNIVKIDHYYSIGRLIPASSINGTNIFFTPDAMEEGKDVQTNAKYFQAATGLTPTKSGTSMMATLHAKTDTSDGWAAPSGSTYSGATTYANTNDDGYYVDIPVWIRTSSDSDVGITVKGYVKSGGSGSISTASGATDELYKATRVAILNESGTNVTSGTINLKDGSGTGWTGSTSIVDYYGTNAAHKVASGAVKAAAPTGVGGVNDPENPTATKQAEWNAVYGTAQVYDGTTSIATIAGSGKNSTYGAPTKLWIRVWLEGEDPECWNQNAGQDWNISLKFEKM
ncbi:MAG: hypothetical protein K6F80_00865 [Oscillospiraceae bacterium]|nr:hypothetical protein [Oscillospiraceae bacterium]